MLRYLEFWVLIQMNKFKYLEVNTYDTLPSEYVIVNIVVAGLNFDIDDLLQIAIADYSIHGEIKESFFNLAEAETDIYETISEKLDNKYVVAINPNLIGKFLYSNLKDKVVLPKIKFVSITDLNKYFEAITRYEMACNDYFEVHETLNTEQIYSNISLINKEYLMLKEEIEDDLDRKFIDLNCD